MEAAYDIKYLKIMVDKEKSARYNDLACVSCGFFLCSFFEVQRIIYGSMTKINYRR